MNAIRATQQGNKGSRNAVFEKIKKLDEQLKSRLAELKTAKGRVNFRSVEDVDQEIARLQKQVDSGMMKLVDEKKALSEISNLNKTRKNFSAFDSQQKAIDDLKAQIAEQKKTLDDPEQKALSEKYTKLQTELDALKAEQDDAFKSLKALREETDKARALQQEKYQARKELKDAYYQQKRAFAEYDFQARKIRNEKRKQEQLQYLASKRKEAASKRLEEASAPAYQEEIYATEGLIRHFDPSALPAKETASTSQFAASAQRTVDDSGLKGTRVSKKDQDEESYFVGTGGKKGKKGKKGPAAPAAAKFNLNIGIIEELAKVGVDAPSSQAEVPATVEKLNEKLAFWKKDQDRKTKEVSLSQHHILIRANIVCRTSPRHRKRLSVLRLRRLRVPTTPLMLPASPLRRMSTALPHLPSSTRRRTQLPTQLKSSRRLLSKTKRRLQRHRLCWRETCSRDDLFSKVWQSSSDIALPMVWHVLFLFSLGYKSHEYDYGIANTASILWFQGVFLCSLEVIGNLDFGSKFL